MSSISPHQHDEYVTASPVNSGFQSSQGKQTILIAPPRSALTSIFVAIGSTVGICVVLSFFFFFLFAMMIASMSASVAILEAQPLPEKIISGDLTASKKVAIITISGMIVGGEESFIKKQIDAAKADKDVVAVVLRVNSPGGTVVGSEYYLHHLKELKKERGIPVVVSMGTLATSGGYYVSMCADEIFAESATWTGSIGVIVNHYDASELFGKIGVNSDPITSGPMKTMSSMSKPLSEEERKIWQELVDELFEQFKQVVRDGRQNFAQNPEKLDELATGQIYSAKQAKESGLIDEIGFLEDAVDRAIALSPYSKDETKVVKYKPVLSIMDSVLGGEISVNAAEKQTEMAIEMLTPKAYYLAPRYLPLGGEEE